MNKNKFFSIAYLALFTFFLNGCSTTMVPLKYQSEHVEKESVNHPVVSLGEFVDERPKKPNDLGVIRGGYGNVIKRLRTNEPISKVVQQGFADALSAKGLLAGNTENAPFVLDGVINKLDCNYYINKEAHTHITVRLTEAGGKTLFKNQYKSDKTEGGWGAGIFGSAESLGRLAETSMQDAIDQALTDSNLLNILLSHPKQTISPQPAPAASPTRSDTQLRLEDLHDLLKKDLITKQEYDKKRLEIIGDL